MADENTGALMTIGSVSRATGIPSNTIRTWERRYGFPEPERTEAGQRVYRADVVQHLRLVAEALDEGHRARQVLSLAMTDLQMLLGAIPSSETGDPVVPMGWRKAVRELDSAGLDSSLRRECARMGALRFVTERAGPFMNWVGDAWESGDVQVYQEHFTSDHVRAVLADTWRSLAPSAAATVVCATVPGELHDLGVHMAAVAVASGGRRPVVLPGSTPTDEVIAAVRSTGARLVAISVSACSEECDARAALEEIRRGVPESVAIWVGGAGAPQGVKGVTNQDDLTLLARRRVVKSSGTTGEEPQGGQG